MFKILCGSLADLPTACTKLDAENRQKRSTVKRACAHPETASFTTRIGSASACRR
jgi:hypothetical protein